MRDFKEDLVEQLQNFEEAQAYLISAVDEEDEDFLLDAINLVTEAWSPAKISQLAGGSKLQWASIKNPAYSTIKDFLSVFGLKIIATEKA